MEKIRIGNDMRVNFSVYRNGEPESFDGASNVVTKLVNEAYNKEITHTYTIAGNIVQFDIDALQLTQCGKCRLFISYTKGGDYTVDSPAFELVNYTDQTGGTEIIGVEIVSINIAGDIGINRDGLSAYEVWESYPGNEGKMIEQYFEWLRENPTKTDTSRKIIAGLGLTGGGDFTTDRTIDIGTTDDSVVVGADGIKVDTQDSLTSTSITKPLSAAKGKALQDTKANKTVTIEAGNGLTGGGDLSADRTIDVVSANDGITVNADNIQLNTIDNVTSTSATKPLSANQGKVLNDKVVQVETDLNQLEILTKYTGQWYGVEWGTTVSASAATRIGNMSLHYLLPIQSRMRRCLLLDNGTVNYYLHPTDSTKKEDGSSAILNGTDGQVMVEIPEFFIRFEMEGTKRRCLMSMYPLPGFNKVEKMYISAYEAALDRTNLKLSSVVNNTAQFRGGNNNAANDLLSKTFLGRPATALSLTQFRTYARNRGSVNWNCNAYLAQKILYWLIAVEYGNFNNQLAYNPALTAEGYRQGGLGSGVTDIDGTKWSNFNGYYPFIPCGHTNGLGNATGIVAYSMPSEYDATIKTTYVPTYRGVENPFGHIWKWTDGCKCNIQSDASGGLSEFYVCNNPTNFQDADYANYVLRGLLPRTEGYIKSLIVGEYGEMMPLTVGGSSTTYMSDYFYTSIPASGVSQRGVLFGGDANTGAAAGVGCSNSGKAATYAYADVGSRLCYIF